MAVPDSANAKKKAKKLLPAHSTVWRIIHKILQAIAQVKREHGGDIELMRAKLLPLRSELAPWLEFIEGTKFPEEAVKWLIAKLGEHASYSNEIDGVNPTVRRNLKTRKFRRNKSSQ